LALNNVSYIANNVSDITYIADRYRSERAKTKKIWLYFS